MKSYFKHDLKQSFLVLEGEEGWEEDFQTRMLNENNIPGILKINVKFVDNKVFYYYDISGKNSLKTIYEKAKLKRDQIKKLVEDVIQTIRETQKYMLDGTGIILDPEYIYFEDEKYYFCYYPRCDRDLRKEFHKLTEFFVREVDYKDREGVHLAYTLHKETMEEHYSIEKIMEGIHEEVDVPRISYEEKMEEQKEETFIVAEKKEKWGSVKKLWERAKKEKWGYWEGL